MRTPATDLLERIPKMKGQEFIDEQWSENDWLEFKTIHRSNNDWKKDLKSNFAKTACAFANGSGGLIICGISCPKDKADGLVEIEKIDEIHNLLDGWSTQITEQPIQGIRHGKFDNNTLLYTYVPESSIAPHRNASDEIFYMRSCSNSIKMPLRMIQSMFLARQRGNVRIELDIVSLLMPHNPELKLKITNTGSFSLVDSVIYYTCTGLSKNDNKISKLNKEIFKGEQMYSKEMPRLFAAHQVHEISFGTITNDTLRFFCHFADVSTSVGFGFLVAIDAINKHVMLDLCKNKFIELPSMDEIELIEAYKNEIKLPSHYLKRIDNQNEWSFERMPKQ